MKQSTRSMIAPGILFLVAVLVMIGAWEYYSYATGQPEPTRVEPPPTAIREATTESPTASGGESTTQGVPTPEEPSEAPPLEIAWSDIVHVAIPAVGIDINVSGETFPRQTENCRETEECIDPPVPNEAAWYGVVPTVPSTGSVRIFAHNTPRGWPVEQSFNNLPALMAGDEIVVTTENGIFTYQAEDPQLVPYADVPESQLVWGNEPDRLVLVTCNNQASSGTIVEAWLVDATLR